MSRKREQTGRWANGDCACHKSAMGHVWSAGAVVDGVATGATMQCLNGKYIKCRRTFAEHQEDPRPCALAAYGSHEPMGEER